VLRWLLYWSRGGLGMISINKVLEFAGLDMPKSIKIARHNDTRVDVDVHELYASGHLKFINPTKKSIVLKIVSISFPA
jgi:hypothetical protein